jgi:hypothetical protein
MKKNILVFLVVVSLAGLIILRYASQSPKYVLLDTACLFIFLVSIILLPLELYRRGKNKRNLILFILLLIPFVVIGAGLIFFILSFVGLL